MTDLIKRANEEILYYEGSHLAYVTKEEFKAIEAFEAGYRAAKPEAEPLELLHAYFCYENESSMSQEKFAKLIFRQANNGNLADNLVQMVEAIQQNTNYSLSDNS